MPLVETQCAYLQRLRPYLLVSAALLGIGIAIGLMTISHFPGVADRFEESVAGFVKMFRGLPKWRLAGAIFLNNSVKALLVILLGPVLGVIAALFLVINGAAIGIVIYLSSQSRGFWLSLLTILPHGLLEIPAVLLGTSIGLMLGSHVIKRCFGKRETALGSELGQALKFFLLVIVPLLFVAALVEVFVTPVVAKL
jgi:stage II sporulation protein M